MSTEENKERRTISRRQFIIGSGVVVTGSALVGLAGCTGSATDSGATATATPPAGAPSGAAEATPAAGQTGAKPAASTAYLVVDSLKCSGCLSCMLACSAAHDKTASLSSSRIQITQNPLNAYPYDLEMYQCRQCPEPLCVENCPTGACKVDSANGNVRTIDQSKCIGCQTCVDSCPHVPHRVAWKAETKKAVKCDLCADAPYLGQEGGPNGKQACVMTCPMGAIAVVTDVPNQRDTQGYEVNLREDA